MIGTHGTEYVSLRSFEARNDTKRAEYRVTESEAHPGLLEIGVYGWNSGYEYSTMELTADAAAMMLESLPNPFGSVVHLSWFRQRFYDRRFGRWDEQTVPGAWLRISDTDSEHIPLRISVEVGGKLIEQARLTADGQQTLIAAVTAYLADQRNAAAAR